MYISSGFLNKNAHKFFNGNVEKNDFFGINKVRFMSGSVGGATYTHSGAFVKEVDRSAKDATPSVGVTDSRTTEIGSLGELQSITGGKAYLPPDVYAALARGEKVAVTLSQRPPERVNLLIPVFAAFAQMAGSSGAAYNKELGEAIQGKGAGSGTGLGAAADFVNRYGGDYSLNPFGGASHIDIDAQYEILGKKEDPKKEKVPPLAVPQINPPTKKRSHFTPEEKEKLQREQPELFALTNGTVHFDTKDPKIQNTINEILKKNPNISEMKLLLDNFSFSENVLSPAQKTLLDNQVKTLQKDFPSNIFNSDTGSVNVEKVNSFVNNKVEEYKKSNPNSTEEQVKNFESTTRAEVNDFIDVVVDAHEVGVKTQANSKTDSTKPNANEQQIRKQEYHTIVGGDEYLVPFAKDLIKQGIDISSLRTNGEIDQKKVLELVNYLNDPKSTPKPSQDIINKIGNNDVINGSAKQIKADFNKYGLGMTEEQQAKKFINSYTGAGTPPTDVSVKDDSSTYASSFIIAPQSPLNPKNPNPSKAQMIEYSNLVINSVKAMDNGIGNSKLESLPKEIKDAVRNGKIDTLNRDQLKTLCRAAEESLGGTNQMSDPAKKAVVEYLQTAVGAGVVTLKDKNGKILSKDDIKNANPSELRKLFHSAETELRAGGTGSDGFLGAHHITALQMAIINKAQDMSQLSSLALKSYEGKKLEPNETKKLTSLLKEYNKNHDPNISLKSPISKETIVNLLNQTKGELQSLQSNVLESHYGSGESAHPELKQMCDEIGKFISGAPEENGKKMGINSAIEKISKESTIPDTHVTLKNELADLTNASAGIAKISSGDMPLTEPFKIGLDKVIEQYNKENPNATVSVDTDKLGKDDSLKLLGFIETKMKNIKTSAETSKFTDISSKVEAKLDLNSDTSISGIKNSITNDPNTTYFNEVKNQTESLLKPDPATSSPKPIDKESLKTFEKTFIDMLKAPEFKQKPEYREIIAEIAQNFAKLNANCGDISTDIKTTLDDLLKANNILDTPPKPAPVTNSEQKTPVKEASLGSASQPEQPVVVVQPVKKEPSRETQVADLLRADARSEPAKNQP